MEPAWLKPPVEPWPPSPRTEPGSVSTSTKRARATRWTTIWAMRSPRLSCDRRSRIEVDEHHEELATITRVDRPGRVDDRHTTLRRETRARVDEGRIAGRKRHRDAGRHHLAFAGAKEYVDGRDQIGTRVTGVRVGGKVDVGIEPPDQDRNVLEIGHAARPYPAGAGEPPRHRAGLPRGNASDRTPWKTRLRGREVDMTGSKLGWMLVRSGSTFVAVAVTKKAVDLGWRWVTGNEPPTDPEDPDLTWKEAVTWALASGVGIAVARLLATRQAAQMWRRWTGELPPGFGSAGDSDR